MDLLLKGVIIIDPSSPFHQQTADVFVQNGVIAEIGFIDKECDKTVSVPGLHLCPGFTDPFSFFGDPGYESAETIVTGSLAAAYGGYTDVFLLPNTLPVVHHKQGVDYLVQKSQSMAVTIHPLGAITNNAEGKELAEMYDMHSSGAVAFSDGLNPLQSAGVMTKALQYVKAIQKTIIQVPVDASLAGGGLMNEGIVSTRLGLPGQPSIAEELLIARDIELANYSESKLHLTGVSTAKGIQAIRQAKASGIAVSCSVTPYHLYFIDEDLAGYDTNLKVSPPLRTAADRAALQDAVIDGTVDCIASHHLPRHIDQKMVEFEYAKNGMTGLETCFAAVRSALPQLSLERLVELFSIAPRQLFGLAPYSININQPASLTLVLPHKEWAPDLFYSKSKNSAFTGRRLTGKPVGIIHKDRLFLRP